jgi:transmembrane sensor
MAQEKRTKLNAQISEEAAEWFVQFRLGDVDVSGRQEFDTWVRSAPEHLRAYLEIAAIWNEGSSLDPQRELSIDVLTSLARAEGNVVALARPPGEDSTKWFRQPRIPRPRYRWFAIAASIVFLTLAAGSFAWFQYFGPHIYSTDVAEQRSVRLSDGSTVELNSRSRIRVRFSEHEREVDLLEGQVLFHVAKDRTRPFVVHSGKARVQAVGTQFDMYRKQNGTVVTVLEGRVAVSNGEFETGLLPIPAPEVSAPRVLLHSPTGNLGASPNTPDSDAVHPPMQADSARVYLSAGEQVTLTPKVAPRLIRANVSATTAWTQGQLVLDSAPLADAAEEFNRYSTRRLVVEDASVHPLRLSGVFSTDPDFFIRYLRQRPDITVQETESEIRIIRHD